MIYLRLPLIIFFLLVGLAPTLAAEDAPKTPIPMRIAAVQGMDMVYVATLKKMARAIEKASKGMVEVELVTAGKPGPETDILKALIKKRLQAGFVSVTVVAQSLPAYRTLNLPFLFSSYRNVNAFIDSPLDNAIRGTTAHKNLRVMGYGSYGNYGLLVAGEVFDWENVLTQTIRLPKNDWLKKVHKRLGLKPLYVPSVDLAAAMESKALFGVLATPELLQHSGLAKPGTTFIQLNHLHGWSVFMVSAKWFKGLPAKIAEDVEIAIQVALRNGLKRAAWRESAVLAKWKQDGPLFFGVKHLPRSEQKATLRPTVYRAARRIEKQLDQPGLIKRLWENGIEKQLTVIPTSTTITPPDPAQ